MRLFYQRVDRQRSFESLKLSIHKRPSYNIGLAFCFSLLWTALCCVGPEITLDSNPLFGRISSLPFWLGPLACLVAANVVIALHFRQTRWVNKSTGRLIVLACLMCLSVVFRYLWLSDDLAQSWLFYGGFCLLFGASGAVFRVEIDRLFGWIGTRQTFNQGILGTLLSALALTVLFQLSDVWAHAAALVSGIVALVFLWLSIKKLPQSKLYHHGCDVKLPFPFKFAGTSFVQGFSMGLVYCGLTFAGVSSFGGLESFFATILAVALLLVIIVFFRLDFNRLIYKLGFPFIALGFMLLPLTAPDSNVGLIVIFIGFCYLDLILWSLGACLIKNMGLPAPWIASCPGAALYLGMFIGSIVVLLFGEVSVGVLPNIFTGGTSIACVLLALALLMSSDTNLKHGWGTIRPNDETTEEVNTQDVVRFLSNEHELTNREAEVFLLLAQGKTRSFIQSDLCVSSDTIKTHVQHIYRKLVVHSQQELLDLVAQEKEKYVCKSEDSPSLTGQ